MKKKWVVLIGIAAFLFGLTWKIDARSPYGECRGAFRIRQRVVGIEFTLGQDRDFAKSIRMIGT